MTSATDLAALLCSRLCHDLLSPVGALSNGLELLADEKDPEMRKRCFELLDQSAKISTDKLNFFRLAYGAGRVSATRFPPARPRDLVAADLGHEPSSRVAVANDFAQTRVRFCSTSRRSPSDALVRADAGGGAERRDGSRDRGSRRGAARGVRRQLGKALDARSTRAS